MYEVFTKLLNMSLTASILVLFVILVRFVLKKAPKKYICILWALVAFRLLCPFSISSAFSAYNMLQQNTVSEGRVEYFEYNGRTEKPELTFEIPILVNDNYSPDSMTIGVKTSGVYMPLVVNIWFFSMIVMLAYAAVSYCHLRKEVRASIKKSDDVYVCDEITSPFILGIIRPRIYMPSGISEEVKENVVAHERAHIKRLDHLWKPLGFLLLSVYWFNPLMWVAYVFLCKDIEAACDEEVISQMDREHIASYSEALLVCASQRRMITACPIAFGETDVKGRIKNILSYKKPAFWIICISLLVCVVVAVCFLTNPKKDNVEEYMPGTDVKNDGAEYILQPENSYVEIIESNGDAETTDEYKEVVESNTDTELPEKRNSSQVLDLIGLEIKLFKEMSGEYWLRSGTGGWETRIYLYSDGYFVGVYEDSDADSIERCEFSGHFQYPMDLNEYTYLTHIEGLVYEEPGKVSEEDGLKVTTAIPYGLEDAPTTYITVPETSVSELGNIGYDWLSAEREEFRDKDYEEAKEDVLPCFVIRNIDSNNFDEVDYVFTKVPEKYQSDLGSKRNSVN